MGLTYDNVFGESIEPIQPVESPVESPVEESQLVAHTPILIPALAIAIILLCSIAIVPALILVSIVGYKTPALIIGSIAISLGQPHSGIPLSQTIRLVH
jgi:hypothetical protein